MKSRNNKPAILFLILSLTVIISSCDYEYTFPPYDGLLFKQVDYFLRAEIKCSPLPADSFANITILDEGLPVTDADVIVNANASDYDIPYDLINENYNGNIGQLDTDNIVNINISIGNTNFEHELTVPDWVSNITPTEGSDQHATQDINFTWNGLLSFPDRLLFYISEEDTASGTEYSVMIPPDSTSHTILANTLPTATMDIEIEISPRNMYEFSGPEYEDDSFFKVETSTFRHIDTY